MEPRDAARILLWPFYEGPDEYQALSPHGGVRAIGVCDTSEHRVEGGTVFIGAHA